jgi:hypothetical protein
LNFYSKNYPIHLIQMNARKQNKTKQNKTTGHAAAEQKTTVERKQHTTNIMST